MRRIVKSRGVFIDPRWGLEEIIASLAGLTPQDVSVFAASAAHDETTEPPPRP